jgi:HAD superfamily hydrolase (TIGR01490 family)
VVARVNHPKNQWLFTETWGVDVSVSTPQLLTALVEEAVSVGSLVRLLRFEGGNAHLVEVTLAENSPADGVSVVDLGVPRDATIVAVVRSDHLIVPRGDTRLAAGDEVLGRCRGRGTAPAGRALTPMRAAFFDLDKTVIAKASIAAFGRPFYRGGLINRRLIARAVVSQIIYLHLGASEQKLARVRESMLALTKGWDREQIREIVREALEETVEPIIYAEALDLIEAHRAAGHKVYLVSASPEEIVEPLAEHLGVDGCIATRAVVDEEGRYAGEMEFYAYGPFKAEAMRALADSEDLDLAESSAYSDSYTDLPMLEAVGHPVAVNPDRVLAKVAREREWEVMQFTKPVRLRDRVSVPSLSTTATAAGVTAVATAGALVAWRMSRRAHS